jgi:hypothetical protein
MATRSTPDIFTDSPLPLYRLDTEIYSRLVEAGALEGLDVELLDGVLVNRHPRGPDPIHRIDVGTYERMVATGELEGLPIELLEGLLVEVSPQGEEHAEAIVYLTRHLDVPAKTVEVRTEPGPQGYSRCEIYGLGTTVPSPAAGVEDLDVTTLFAG